MYAVIMRHSFAFFCAFLLGIYLVPIIIRAALRIGFVDAPDGHLKHQKSPVPYLGGVAVFLPFIATLGLCYPFQNQALWLLLGITLLLFIGLIDDLRVLKPSQKFFGQTIAVLCFLKGEFSLKTDLFSFLPNVLLSGFWILSVVNAFNLVDVMDGLCATLALISALVLGIIAWFAGNYQVSVLMAAFGGSIAAFLYYNRPPARIYLGDSGSLFIGGFLAAIPLLLSWDSVLFGWHEGVAPYFFMMHVVRPLCEVFFIPAIVLALPLLELGALFVIRTRMGIPFYNGSPHHFSLYLQRKGWSKQQILWFVGGLSALLGIQALVFMQGLASFKVHIIADALLLAIWFYLVY